MKTLFFCLGAFLFSIFASQGAQEINVDVCVYGGTSGGVVAAVQAARMGKSVALVALNTHVGGMTTSGLGWTDIGHVGDDYIQGVSREFYTRIGQKYGTGFKTTFEPHVAEAVYNDMLQQAGVQVFTNQFLTNATRFGQQLAVLTMNNGNVFRAKVFIDGTYTGDLLPAAGVSYIVGRESSAQYGESLGGIQLPNSDFTGLAIDPYVISNTPASGILPLIQASGPGLPGNADTRVQAYSFRLCLTTVATNKLPITAPTNYDASQFELFARNIQALVAAGTPPTLATFLTIDAMPNGKTDINNSAALSTDFVGESAPYVEADHDTRAQIWQAHKNYVQGMLYFLGNDPRVPASLRASMLAYGFSKDEFFDNGGWPYEIYVREARRMVSDYVMTQSNVFNLLKIPDSIGMAGYFTDSHYCQRVLVNGAVRNEGSARGDITSPYPIAYRSLVPRVGECTNLVVPWALSASHTAFSSIRMEPVFMILGQAAGTAAALAIDDGIAMQSVDVAKLQDQLMADQQAPGLEANNSIIVDDTNATGVTIVGTWISSTATSGFYGSDYLHDGNTNKGASSVTFAPTLPQSGLYQVYARWTAQTNRATNVPIDIIYATGTNTVVVNQTQQGGQWVLLMTTNFDASTSGKVRIRNTGTSGYVIADAVEFVPTTNQPIVNIWATDASASRWTQAPGSFTIGRTGNTNVAVTVNLTFSGTALNGADYHSVASSVLLPAGMLFTNLSILPFTNSQPVGDKLVTIGFASSAAYSIGNLASAAIIIRDVPNYQWRKQYFGINATNLAIAGDNANPAGDGVPNLVKYAFGLNPLQPEPAEKINAVVPVTNGFFQIAFTRPDPPPPDIQYLVEASDDLTNWCSNPCVTTNQIIVNSNNTVTITFEGSPPANGAARKFMRLRVSK